MANSKDKELQFTQDVDAMLSGKQPGATPAADSEGKADLEFAGKIREAHAAPTPVFQAVLKQRLLAKLTEMETADESRKAPSLKDWFGRVFSQRTWQVTGALAVLLIASLVVWRTGLFTQGPVVTNPYPTVAVEASASLDKDAYSVGETIEIAFSFKNLSSQALAFPFPPSFRIETVDAQTLRIFPAGAAQKSLSPGEGTSYNVSWDQKDDTGAQVPAGQYQIVMPNAKLDDAGFLSLTRAPILVIAGP
jgi:hypothetical protein